MFLITVRQDVNILENSVVVYEIKIMNKTGLKGPFMKFL